MSMRKFPSRDNESFSRIKASCSPPRAIRTNSFSPQREDAFELTIESIQSPERKTVEELTRDVDHLTIEVIKLRNSHNSLLNDIVRLQASHREFLRSMREDSRWCIVS